MKILEIQFFKSVENEFSFIRKEWKTRKALYLMCIPALIQIIAFKYLPLGGIIIAFKNYNFRDGIFGSSWVGLDNFEFLIRSNKVLQVLGNTLLLNSLFITIVMISALILSLIFNEVKSVIFKKVTQSIILLPFFISWIVISVVVYNLLNYEFGSVNQLLKTLGLNPVKFYSEAAWWRPILVLIKVWHDVGWSSVIFLATLSGISPELYEAAKIDGAGRFKQIIYISLPHLYPTISILLIMAIGRIFNADFGMIYGIIGDNPLLYSSTDVIDTYVYRALRQLGDIGMSSAVGFLQSIFGFTLVLISNWGAKKLNNEGGLF